MIYKLVTKLLMKSKKLLLWVVCYALRETIQIMQIEIQKNLLYKVHPEN